MEMLLFEFWLFTKPLQTSVLHVNWTGNDFYFTLQKKKIMAMLVTGDNIRYSFSHSSTANKGFHIAQTEQALGNIDETSMKYGDEAQTSNMHINAM